MEKAGKKQSNSLFETKDLLFVWRLIKKNIFIIILTPVFAYLIGYIYTYRLPIIYSANAQLLLKSDQTYDYQDPIYKGLGAYGMYMDVRNQIRILQSRDLIGEVVEKLDVDVSYYIVGRLRKQEVFGTLPFRAEPEVYSESGTYNVPIKVRIVDSDNYILELEENGTVKSYDGKFDDLLITANFGVTLIKNYKFDENNLSRLKESDYEIVIRSKDFMISHFQRNIGVENLEHTSILNVQVSDQIPSRGKMFLDTLCHVFIGYSQRTQLEVNRNTLDNIEKQIGEVQKILVAIQNDLLRFKDDNDIINLTKEEEAYFNTYIDYSERNRELQRKKSSIMLLENYISNTKDERLLPPSFYIMEGDEYLRTNVDEFYALQLQVGDQVHNYTDDHPTIINMKENLVEIKKDILIYIANLKIAIEEQIVENNAIVNKFKESVQGIPRTLQGVDNIRRELEVNNKMYLFLLEKKTNTLIARAGIIPQVQIIESSTTSGVIGPNKSKIRNLFLLGGLILAFLISLIRKLFFEKLQSVEELKEMTDIPVLAGISMVKDLKHPIVIDHMPKSNVAEAFRTLRSNISFMGGTEGTKKIVISSFLPGEGKTFCISNLAAIIARTGKKVLLIDFDLHKPRVHKIFGLENDNGISNILIGKSKFEEVVKREVTLNLDLVLCGPLPPNPSELISQNTIETVISDLEKDYDYIFFDSPPFGILNDAIDLSRLSTIFLIVMNQRYARRTNIPKVEQALERTSVTSKGFIMNSIKMNKLTYYYNKYSYKYGYSYARSYGYGYDYGSGYGSDYEE